MTYREKLQEIIREIWVAYDQVGAMRDSGFDKEPYNIARGKLHDAAIALGKHDNKLSDREAQSKL